MSFPRTEMGYVALVALDVVADESRVYGCELLSGDC